MNALTWNGKYSIKKWTEIYFHILQCTFQKQLYTKKQTDKQLTSLIIRCMMVFGTRSRVILLIIARYEATKERIISTWRSSEGSDLPTSSFDCNTNQTKLSNADMLIYSQWHIHKWHSNSLATAVVVHLTEMSVRDVSKNNAWFLITTWEIYMDFQKSFTGRFSTKLSLYLRYR